MNTNVLKQLAQQLMPTLNEYLAEKKNEALDEKAFRQIATAINADQGLEMSAPQWDEETRNILFTHAARMHNLLDDPMLFFLLKCLERVNCLADSALGILRMNDQGCAMQLKILSLILNSDKVYPWTYGGMIYLALNPDNTRCLANIASMQNEIAVTALNTMQLMPLNPVIPTWLEFFLNTSTPESHISEQYQESLTRLAQLYMESSPKILLYFIRAIWINAMSTRELYEKYGISADRIKNAITAALSQFQGEDREIALDVIKRYEAASQ
ncbi:MAG: hypothetical protein PHC51_01935 [bacterium]|nr:hypothetical protein [bacterium]